MPYQIKNGIIYSGNAVTLTQAQYDALTTAEKNNGTVYYIYDSDAMIEAQEVGLDGGNVEDLAGSVATFETSPSTAVHAEGEYILYQAQLYKVTSAIAVGEDLTVGSNIEATTAGAELTSLNKGLPLKVYESHVRNVRSSTNSKLIEITAPEDGIYILSYCGTLVRAWLNNITSASDANYVSAPSFVIVKQCSAGETFSAWNQTGSPSSGVSADMYLIKIG